jgi:hypothetical protein
MEIPTTPNGLIMENEEFDEDGTFTVNIHRVAKDNTVITLTRLLATSLIATPYLSVGDFFKNLSEDDLNTLNEISDEEHKDFDNILLIAEMLATGEGLDHGDMETIRQRMNQFIMFVAMEGLHRKGLVKLYHENMSFGDDMGSKIVVEKI